VTTAATFGAINFYTQWFERLGAEPWALIVAGLTIVGVAVGL
jgi:iron complex transport system permease protein